MVVKLERRKVSENYWASDSINISQALYDKLNELAQKRFSYTGQGIIDDLVEEILQNYVNKENQIRFQVETHFDEIFPYVFITSTKIEDQDNDFLGKMDLPSKEAVIRVAKDGWGILEDEIEFVN